MAKNLMTQTSLRPVLLNHFSDVHEVAISHFAMDDDGNNLYVIMVLTNDQIAREGENGNSGNTAVGSEAAQDHAEMMAADAPATATTEEKWIPRPFDIEASRQLGRLLQSPTAFDTCDKQHCGGPSTTFVPRRRRHKEPRVPRLESNSSIADRGTLGKGDAILGMLEDLSAEDVLSVPSTSGSGAVDAAASPGTGNR